MAQHEVRRFRQRLVDGGDRVAHVGVILHQGRLVQVERLTLVQDTATSRASRFMVVSPHHVVGFKAVAAHAFGGDLGDRLDGRRQETVQETVKIASKLINLKNLFVGRHQNGLRDMAPLHLTLLGGFQARSLTDVAIAIPIKKAKALLAYLALHPGQLHPRDKLAALLWEDSGETQARHSLRQALVGLRKAFPRPAHVIAAEDDALTIPPQAIEVDVLTFERLLREGTPEALEQAVALYQGELLEGFNPGAAGFEEWLMERRGRLRERAIAAAEALLVRQLADPPGSGAIGLALRLVSWDPLRESAQRTLMELYARQGRHGAALKQYQICRAVLRRELGVEPDAQTEALHQHLLQQRRAFTTATSPASPPPAPTDGPGEWSGDPPPAPVRPGVEAATTIPPETAELRQASVLVARLASTNASESLDLENRHAARQALLARVHAASERFGGWLIQQAPDAVMVVFGIPQARGNEAERAVHAALALQQASADADPSRPAAPARIGIASGLVLVSPWRAEPHAYTVTGDAVQTAEALCNRAGPTETLLADTVYASLRGQGRGREPGVGNDSGGAAHLAPPVPARGTTLRAIGLHRAAGAVAATRQRVGLLP